MFHQHINSKETSMDYYRIYDDFKTNSKTILQYMTEPFYCTLTYKKYSFEVSKYHLKSSYFPNDHAKLCFTDLYSDVRYSLYMQTNSLNEKKKSRKIHHVR